LSLQDVLGCEEILVDGDLTSGVMKIVKVVDRIKCVTELESMHDKVFVATIKGQVYTLYFTLMNSFFSDLYYMNEDKYLDVATEYESMLMHGSNSDQSKYANIQQYIVLHQYN
jgi:hypothetical protein